VKDTVLADQEGSPPNSPAITTLTVAVGAANRTVAAARVTDGTSPREKKITPKAGSASSFKKAHIPVTKTVLENVSKDNVAPMMSRARGNAMPEIISMELFKKLGRVHPSIENRSPASRLIITGFSNTDFMGIQSPRFPSCFRPP